MGCNQIFSKNLLLARRARGATLIEYAALLAVVFTITIPGISFIGKSVKTPFISICDAAGGGSDSTTPNSNGHEGGCEELDEDGNCMPPPPTP